MYKFNGVALTEETILKTRKWFSDNSLACIEEAESGKVFVNDLNDYREWNLQSSEAALKGEHDHTFTFLQRAHYIQTGESVPMFSR